MTPDELGEVDVAEDGAWHEVLRLPAKHADGREAVVDCAATPARFYRVHMGDASINTGTGCEAFVLSLAELLTDGMVAIR